MKAKLIKVNNIYTLMDGDKMVASSDSDFQTDYEVMKLSKENCDEIFRVVDVEKLVEEEYREFPTNPKDKPEFIYGRDTNCHRKRKAYLKGYNKAMELNKDKLFTVEDIELAMVCMVGQEISYGRTHEETRQMRHDYIKSYINYLTKQPKEIEVDIEMETKQQLVNGYRNQPDNVIGFIAEYVNILVPKLDSSGCLILSKI